MAHELRSSKDMFYVGETPWHGLGTKIEGRPTSEEAIKAAHLDWEVGLLPLFAGRYVEVPGPEGTTKLVPENDGTGRHVKHKATYRMDTGETLGVVGPGWKPLQNREAFGFFDQFVAAGQAAYETAGALRGGKRVWILAELSGDPLVIVPKADDVVKQYLLLSNGHDGSLAVRAGYTPVRAVCANTLAMAHNDDASALVKIRHHGSTAEALQKLAETMNVVKQTFEATAEQYRALAAKGCDSATLVKYVNLVFAPKKEAMILAAGKGLSAEALNTKVYGKIVELFETGRGNALPGVKGTLWGAYNAINEYLVHERGKDAEKRLDSAWFGEGAAQNAKALKVGVELAIAA